MPKGKRGKGKKAGKPAAGGQAPPAAGEETPPTGVLARIGRPTKLTLEVQRAMCERIEAGVSFDTAAELEGVGSDTAREWIARGLGRDKDRPPAPHFAAAIARARAKDEARRVKEITAAAAGGQLVFERTHTKPDGSVTTERRFAAPDWRAHAWILERRDPERWGPVNVSPPNPPPPGGGFDLLTILAPSAATGGSIPKTRIDVTPVEPHDPRPLKPKV